MTFSVIKRLTLVCEIQILWSVVLSSCKATNTATLRRSWLRRVHKLDSYTSGTLKLQLTGYAIDRKIQWSVG